MMIDQRTEHLIGCLLGFGHSLSYVAKRLELSVPTIRAHATQKQVKPVNDRAPDYSRELHHYLMGQLHGSPRSLLECRPERTTFMVRSEIAAPMTQLFINASGWFSPTLYVRADPADSLGYSTRITLLTEGIFLAFEQARICKNLTWDYFSVAEPFASSRAFWRGAIEAGSAWTAQQQLIFRPTWGKPFFNSFNTFLRNELQNRKATKAQQQKPAIRYPSNSFIPIAIYTGEPAAFIRQLLYEDSCTPELPQETTINRRK